MAIDSQLFRQTLGRFLTGVTVVACDVGGEVQAMTANAFTSVSLDPPLILFCPGRSTKTGQMVSRFGRFSVNILRDEQQALGTYFAGGWREPSPPHFNFVTDAETPRLEGCLVSLLCRVYAVHEGGDHWIVVGEVHGIHRGVEPLRPLGFHLGRYTLLEQVKTAEAPDLYSSRDLEPVHYHYQSW
jgi:flavin reductase (DIM6/NTAB) family NADH-FMN oxidoreductase RutF